MAQTLTMVTRRPVLIGIMRGKMIAAITTDHLLQTIMTITGHQVVKAGHEMTLLGMNLRIPTLEKKVHGVALGEPRLHKHSNLQRSGNLGIETHHHDLSSESFE
jgi:hypothetical protein